MLHACDSELLIGHWHMSKAVYFSGAYQREYKDIIAAGVSAANACSYCLEAHGDLAALNYKDVGTAIRRNAPTAIGNSEQRALFEWARNSLQPGMSKFDLPALADNRVEIVAVALMFHYVNRIVNIMLEDSPLMLPKIPGLKKVIMTLARPVLRNLASKTVERPGVINNIDLNSFDWAANDPVIQSSFCFFESATNRAIANVLSAPTQQKIIEKIQTWQGESMPMSRSWVEEAVVDVNS